MAAKYILARSAGFCFGVERSIRMAEEALDSGACRCLGELIHNRDAVALLEEDAFEAFNVYVIRRRKLTLAPYPSGTFGQANGQRNASTCNKTSRSRHRSLHHYHF